MAERLTGEQLIAKVREITSSSGDERALKSRICVGCGYVHDNGLPDFVGFYNALKEAKGETESPEKETVSPERLDEVTTEVKHELGEYAGYLTDQTKQSSDKEDAPTLLGMIAGRVANSLESPLQFRLKLAKSTGLMLLLSDQGLRDLSEHYDDIDEDEKALEILSMLLKRTPDDVDLIFRRAIRLKILDKFEEAITDLTRLIDLKSMLAVAHRYRAECRLENNDVPGAVDDAQKVLELRTNNLNARGAYEVLKDAEDAKGNITLAQELQQRIDELKKLPDLLDFTNPEKEVFYKRDDFDDHWKKYREENYLPMKESANVPFDIDSLFDFSKDICTDAALEDWERESVCLRATDELAKFPLLFRSSEERAALRQKLDGPLRHFIANLKKPLADHYVQIGVEVIAHVKDLVEDSDLDCLRKEVGKMAKDTQGEIYQQIHDECADGLAELSKLVILAKEKSPFSSTSEPLLRKEEFVGGRISVFWGDPEKSPEKGRSYTYLIDFEGDICVKEFDEATPCASIKERYKLPYIAATIVQDVYGQYDRENTVALIEAASYLGPIAEKAGSIEEVVESVKEAADEVGFFENKESTDTLKAFLTAIQEDQELEIKLRAVKNPLQIIQIAEKHGFQGLTPDALEKAWFGEPIVPKYLFHHFKRRGAVKSTSMLLYEAQGALINAMKRGDEEKVLEARKQVMELEKVMKMDSSEWTKQYLKKRLND